MQSSKIFEVQQFADDFSTLPIWKLSCYAPGRGLPVQLCDGTDLSPEESKMNYYQSGGNFDQVNAFVQKLEQEASWRYEYLKQHPNEAADYINMVHQSGYNKYTGSGPSPQTFFDVVRNRTGNGARMGSMTGSSHLGAGPVAQPQSPRSAFGPPSVSASAFGPPGSSAFGTPAQAHAQTSGAFGSPNHGAFGAPAAGAFGIQNSGAFHAPNSTGFGSPTTGAFGAPTSGAFGAPTSGAFGAPTTGAFGAPSNGAFSTPPSRSFGGQPAFVAPSSEPPNAFNKSYTPSIQSPNNNNNNNNNNNVTVSSPLASAFAKPQGDTIVSSSMGYRTATQAGPIGADVSAFGSPQSPIHSSRPAFSGPVAGQGGFSAQSQSAFAMPSSVPRSTPPSLASAFSHPSSGTMSNPGAGRLSNMASSTASNQLSNLGQTVGHNSGSKQLLTGNDEFSGSTRVEIPSDVEFVLRIQGPYTPSELDAFRADTFQPGKVPIRAPTQTICENRI